MENGTNLMSVQSMTCCLQVTMSCTASAADVLRLTQSIDNAVAMVTAMTACYQFSETVCSQRPAGAHFPFPPSQLQRHRGVRRRRGLYFHVDVMSVELPPLDTHTQPELEGILREHRMVCVEGGGEGWTPFNI